MNNQFIPMRKGTVLMPTGSKEHLHFICCNPVYYPERKKKCVLVVNICSIYKGIPYDKTCTLDINAHPFVKHLSYVYYRKAAILSSDSISLNISKGTFTIHQPCNDPVFQNILDGFNLSDEVRYKIKRFYKNNCQ